MALMVRPTIQSHVLIVMQKEWLIEACEIVIFAINLSLMYTLNN